MIYEALEFDIRDGISWITINRPASFNAMDLKAMQEFLHVANRCSTDQTIRCAVITGAGDKAFCAGGDLASFAGNQDGIALLLKEMTTYFHMAVSRFAWMRAPLIAAVNGAAAGAGLGVVACSDLAIAADTATFTSAYTQVGLTPDGSSSYFLSRILGPRRAMDLFLTNRTLSAEEAAAWGLINRVVPADRLKEEVGKLATRLAQGPTLAYGGVKKLLQMAPNDSLESQMEREARMIADMAMTLDGREGVRAFVEKRKPAFRGE
jgi:2-(1,2-epoxy-1,2-dihydrophenyl)acetyl-CoA isomerase